MGLWPFGKKEEPVAAPAAAVASAAPADDAKPKKKICCACPDTKRLRDECIALRGEEHAYCAALIEAHKACLRLEGFNV
ncbi:Cytochrome c oxidase copper chaperone [Monoraphidium neglectum]|uniref:Cytochrome c oxidase copper chaperone n=1 Tax=Monoraphidium neglectum TaxID=145388 RepID=A0A0D2JCX0_9CHLO|nr:Cytochrome c oxidase copper chaperone [Monoraphidium neglectum]KIY97507.1 Cytochrome c oxidase copper chaperone [Monoraphidium neglectum]|eukprot:XP_013896527.1 Cytochrome c oxidase copper chaperone [Monoraphidium neglectum]